MATPARSPSQRRLADALRTLKQRQDQGQVVFRSVDFDRREREALMGAGFLRLVVKGWYLASRPGDAPGDATPWFTAMRDFVAGYCNARFGDAWHVSPAYSVLVHAGATARPERVTVHSPKGNNTVLDLPAGCSLIDYQAKDFPPADQIEVRGGLRVLPLPMALVRVPEAFFQSAATDAQIALAALPDTSALNRELLAGGHSVVAGRLAGALRATGRPDFADDVLGTMRAVGYLVQESNPFLSALPVLGSTRVTSPYVHRLRLMWRTRRAEVLRSFPEEPGIPAKIEAYLADVRENYTADAYHSLSIEGYRVTEEMIERVATGAWDPEQHAKDADARNAMAAHGYWRAFEAVQASLRRILNRENPGEVIRVDHGVWYRALFGPSVEARILAAEDLAGYRNAPVYIKNAKHIPPSREAVREMMPVLFDLIAEEPSAAVRAVVGHFCFVFIHPYMDGNGRMGRFLMNAMLASGGYPWTVIRVEWRDRYMAALDSASSGGDIGPFAHLLADSVQGRTPASVAPAENASG
ncbi:MAG: Fic family protein [Gemmatimonadetes bacterium]|nr:Fic family protein [Gemmatimonadota bacterium]